MSRATETLAQRLKLARTKRGFGQIALATATQLKQSDISKLENGKILKTTGIARLSNALHVPSEWLEFGEGPTPDWDAKVAKRQPAFQWLNPETGESKTVDQKVTELLADEALATALTKRVIAAAHAATKSPPLPPEVAALAAELAGILDPAERAAAVNAATTAKDSLLNRRHRTTRRRVSPAPVPVELRNQQPTQALAGNKKGKLT